MRKYTVRVMTTDGRWLEGTFPATSAGEAVKSAKQAAKDAGIEVLRAVWTRIDAVFSEVSN